MESKASGYDPEGKPRRYDYTYFAWNTFKGAGRLNRITAGTSGNPTLLLDLQYYSGSDPSYDKAGNLLAIRDYKMGSPQVQTFTYDDLNRLDTAKAESGTSGNYNLEDYTYDTAGRLSAKPDGSTTPTTTRTLTYQDSAHVHAATHINGVQKYWYDANGNQTKRIIGSDTYDLTYDQENRLTQVKKNSIVMATFVYNGDGQRVRQTMNSVTTTFVGEYYEVTGTVRKNYYAGAQMVAYRDNGTLRYVFGDHLGSSTVTADNTGINVTKQLYKAWGETRGSGTLWTKYQFTGQYSYTTDFGLQFYRSRFYDPALGRFTSADTDVPESQGVQAFDRYAYVNNNAVRYVDPTGHEAHNPGDDTRPFGQGRRGTALSVNLAKYTYQYGGDYTSYGDMACGIASGTYGGALVSEIGDAARKHGYTNSDGIQPNNLVKTYQSVYGESNVSARQSESADEMLCWMYDELNAGNIVIVDMLIAKNYQPPKSSSDFAMGTFAHFASIRQIDFDNQIILIDNTLGGDSWSMKLEDFVLCWYNPEIRASIGPGERDELQFWAVSIKPRDDIK